MFLTMFIYGQESTDMSIAEKISFTPLEVYASGVLVLDFQDSATITYAVSKNNIDKFIFEKEISKLNGLMEEKMDLSTFENGYYTIHVFVNSIKIKSITFKKS